MKNADRRNGVDTRCPRRTDFGGSISRIIVTSSSDSDCSNLIETVINSPKPLIAAVNGPAIGIGVTSLALCDLVYSVPHATFHTPFMRWGLAAEACSSVTFPKFLGHPKASALLLAGEVLTAEELCTAGMITRVLPTEGFMDAVLEVAERMAGYSQSAIRKTREMMRGELKKELHEANLKECQALRERSANNDAMPNIIAFIEEQKEKKGRKKRSKL
jgi:peroxisomal 3,2-trans-enoyl-CoA isomerase